MKNSKITKGVFIASVIFVLVSFASISKAIGQNSGTTTTVRYSADLTTVFPNPERGWHNRRDVDGRGGNDDRDFSDVKAAGHTLVHSYLRLDDFKENRCYSTVVPR
jgi:hypothetical protein